MIAALRGVVAEKNVTDAIIDVNGVGYRVMLSLLTLSRLPEVGQPVTVRVRSVVREDAFDLYGFLTRTEEELFLLLTSVSQVGPKMALNVMSGLEVEELVAALARGETARLTKIHGVGKKTADRLVLELKDKVKLLTAETTPKGARKAAASGGVRDDVVSALVNLGYKEAQAQGAADTAVDRTAADAPFELQFREALKVLRSG